MSSRPTPLRRVFAFWPGLLAAALPAQTPAPKATPAQAAAAAAEAALPDFVPPGMFALPDDNLEVTVWARSPLLHNPTNLDVDAQGRLWVTEGVNYRKHLGRNPAGDRVVVLSDSKGEGRADTSYTFVQEPGMIAPLGIAVIDNQVIVSNAPDLIVYTDVNRDGKFDPRVDKREILLTGFNGQNHDHSLHSVTFGPDGSWYLNHGNCGAFFTDRSGRTFRVGSTYDPRSSGATSLFSWKPQDISGATSDDSHVYVGGFTMRMQPDGTHVEVIGYNYRNSYEQCITSFGDVFQNDNDDPPACRTTFLMEYGNTGYFSADGTRTWSADRRPGQTVETAEWRQDDPTTIPAGDVYGAGAPTGILSYEGDTLGAKWRGLIISCEAARNTLFGYRPQPDGAGYKLERFDFLTTNKEQQFGGLDSQRGVISQELKTWFRPSDAVVGPDGAIYVTDWFDPRVGGHQDLDNKTDGAIYRIAPKGFKPVIPKFDLATTEGQITALKSPAINVRASGFLRLRAQGAAAIAPVAALLQDENPFIRARAVWLLAQIGGDGLARVEALLRDADPMMRIVAFRALRRLEPGAPATSPAAQRVLTHARALATDPSPAVRREVALALRDVPVASARDLLVTLAQGYDGHDRSYLAAWGIGCSGKEADVFAALAAKQSEKDAAKWPASYANLVWRLTPATATADFAHRAAATTLTDAERVAAVTALGFTPTHDAAFALLDLAQSPSDAVKKNALWWLLNYRSIRWANTGLDAELKRRGIYDPEKVTVTASIVPPASPTKLPSAAQIAGMTGDARHGAAIAQACRLCHRIGGEGVDYAPNLTGFASHQTAEVVIGAILDPSAEIAHGYEGSEVVLRDGTVVDGIVQSASDPLVIQSMGGLTQLIPTAKVKSRQALGRSLMLSADQLNLSAQDLADVVAFLKTQ